MAAKTAPAPVLDPAYAGVAGAPAGDVRAETQTGKQGKREKKQNRRKSGGFGKFIAMFMIAAVLAFTVGVLAFNLFGIRDKYLVDVLRNVPIVNSLLPKETVPGAGDSYASMSREQLIQLIDSLNTQANQDKKEISDLTDRIKVNESDLQRLLAQEKSVSDFEAEKRAFAQSVVNQNPEAFVKYYESIDRATQDTLYQTTSVQLAAVKEAKNYFTAISAMDEASAAQMLTQLTATDMNLVVAILKNIDTTQTAGILSAMDPAAAARVAKAMSPPLQP